MSNTPYNNTSIKPSDLALNDLIKVIKNGTEYESRLRNLNEFLEDNLELEFSHILGDPYLSETLGPVLTEIDKQLKAHKNEILYLHRLLALLIFELLEQGIELENKELLTELKIYLKYRK